MIEIKEGNYLSRIWFFYKPDAKFDVIAVLHRQLPDGAWNFSYRFRHYEDDKVFDSKDSKSYYTATLPGSKSETKAIRSLGPIINKLKVSTHLDCDVTVIESDDPNVVCNIIRTKPYVYMRKDG